MPQPLPVPVLTLVLALACGSSAAAVSTDGYGEVFPQDNPWNIDISAFPVNSNSANYVTSIGSTAQLHPDFGTQISGVPWGIPYDVVAGTQPDVAMDFVTYPAESDPGPYPFPPDCPVEGGLAAPASSDRHALVVDKDHHLLYELYNAFPQSNGSWTAANGALFNLASNAMRPLGWTSADAAGLPVFPGLARYDEVAAGAIRHALRFTVQTSQNTFVYPARHFASSSSNANLPPMGLRFRLKATANLSGLSPEALIIATCLQHYGMMVADNGGNWFVSGAPDPNWNDADINTLKTLHGSDFEAVDTSSMDPSLNTTPPAAPLGLAAVAGANQVVLSWGANTDADLLGYRVFSAGAAGGPWSEVSSGPVLATTFTAGGLSGGTLLYFQITAEDNATNQSSPSVVVSATPTGAATTSGTATAAATATATTATATATATGASSTTAGTATGGASGSGAATASTTSTSGSGTTGGAGGNGAGGGGGCGLGAQMGILALALVTLVRLGVRRLHGQGPSRPRAAAPPESP